MNPQSSEVPNPHTNGTVDSVPPNPAHDGPSKLSSWAKNLKIPQPFVGPQGEETSGNVAKSPFARFTSGLGLSLSPKSPKDDNSEGTATTSPSGFIGTFTKGLVDSSKNAVKAVSIKARHVVSQNKRRYQEGGFDLDLTYITENIIAMGFPAGDMSSGFFGYVEGFYRNHMEEVIKFFETHHKVASFPFDDHNCPPVQLILSFCQSAYSWLKEDIENVVVVHCKAGMARTGLMISSLLLYLKFFPTAEESIDYYNQKRCIDGKALVLPSACSEVFGSIGALIGSGPPLRSLIIMPEEYWFSAPKKGIMVFALPGEPGLTELAGDFKVHFHDKQGDFYCWLNTTMIDNRKILNTADLDGFDKRKLPSPGFLVEAVLADYDAAFPATPQPEATGVKSADNSSSKTTSSPSPGSADESAADSNQQSASNKKDDVFSDNEAEESGKMKVTAPSEGVDAEVSGSGTNTGSTQISSLTHKVEQISMEEPGAKHNEPKKDAAVGAAPGSDTPSLAEVSDFKAMAADASVFTFGDEEDYESE
nr:phosphatidylinositol 3,4,5-trisphosphate 3-phosphatase and protein-tyrosine-phosphatase PTEN2A [Ipomoea batatas]